MHPRRIPAAMTAERDVIVVGAGFAGLACAQRLASANVDFLVLEASDRIGGRALTTTTVAPGFPLELGALMIHGKRVVTHAWLRELGLHAVRLPTMQTARFVRDGRVARFARLALPFHPTFGTRAFWQAVRGVPRDIRRYGGPDMSLAEFLENEDVLPGAREIVTLLRAHAAAADPDEVGILGHAEEDRAAQEEFGYSNFRLVEGYSALVGRFNRQLDKGRLADLDATGKAIAALAAQRETFSKISAWPWRPEALRSLLSTMAAPIILYLISRLLGRFFGV